MSALLNCVKSKHTGTILISISSWCASYGVTATLYALMRSELAGSNNIGLWFATDSLFAASTDFNLFSMHSLTLEM